MFLKIFEEIVKIDEAYLGGQNKSKRKQQLLKEKEEGKESKRGFGTTKQPVFAILSRSGKVFAKIVPDNKVKDLIPIIENKIKRGSYICSDDFSSYNGLATRGYIHRVVRHRKKEYVDKNNKTNYINGLEGFFVFLKRQLASRGGIRREKLPLYLA